MATSLKVFINKIMAEGRIPESWQLAHITVNPKQDKNKENINNDRPISLLNNDYKIYADMLVQRLKTVLNKVISQDQTGFLPGRKMSNNVRLVIDAIEYLDWNPGKKAASVFVGAEKAFDKVSWRFVEKIIEKMEVGTRISTGFRAIYQDQKVNLIMNGEMTEYFKIERGTRHGCPLSPLLFVLILEVLNQVIRSEEEIRGITLGRVEYRIRAFADDMIVKIEEPTGSISKLLRKMEEFSKVAGFRIKKEKTKVVVKNMDKQSKKNLEQ